MSLENLARACDRYEVSDRAGAAIASAVLKDFGIIAENDMTFVVDRSKLRRERNRHREAIRQKELESYSKVDSIYVDGRKDATITLGVVDEKTYRRTELEEHCVVIGQPGELYLTHVAIENGKGVTIANAIHDAIKDTELEMTLTTVGSDGTAVMTGEHSGFIRIIEELLGRPLQWSICLLHCNELPLRHVFAELDGATSGPDSFSGKIGS